MNVNDLTVVNEKQVTRSIPDNFVEVLSESYEFYFEDGRTHTPEPHERAMLVDFGHGLIAEYEAYTAAEHAEPAPAARSGEVKRLREALEKLLACPAIADETYNDAAWWCPDTAAAISFARAALEYADPEARDNWMTSDGDPLPEGEPIPEPVPYRKEPRMRLTDERGRSPWEGTDLEG